MRFFLLFPFFILSCSQTTQHRSNAADSDKKIYRETLDKEADPQSRGKKPALDRSKSGEVIVEGDQGRIDDDKIKNEKEDKETDKEDKEEDTTTVVDAPIDCETFDWNTVAQAEEVACFSSRTEILESLPQNVRPFWTLVRESESAQGASVEDPRVIVYDPSGRFLLGFETIEGSTSVEVAVFNFEKAEWDFAGLSMQESGVQVEKKLCQTCHSENPKPIWGSYVDWTGSIGANGNLNQEEASFLNTLKNSEHEVYKALQYKNNYSAGTRLRPDHQETAENSQMLNFILGRNGGLAFTKVMMDDSDLTHDDRIKMAHQFLCNEFGHNDSVALLNSYGHDFHRFFSFHKETTGRPFRMHLGFSPAEMHGGLALAEAVFEDDPSYKQMYPNLAATIEGLAPILKSRNSKNFQAGWDRFEFDFSQSKGYGRDRQAFDCP